MAVTIMEALLNAEINLKTIRAGIAPIGQIACDQLHNAVTLLDKGYDLYDKVEPLLEAHGKVENVPDKEAP